MALGNGQTASLETRLYPGTTTGHLQGQLNTYADDRGPLGEPGGRVFSYDLTVEIVTPEPTTHTLLAFGALGLLVRRRDQARRPSPRSGLCQKPRRLRAASPPFEAPRAFW